MARKQAPLTTSEMIPKSKKFGTKSKKIYLGTIDTAGNGRKFVPKPREVTKVTYSEKGERTVHRRNNSPKRMIVWKGRKYYVDANTAEGDLDERS